MNFWEKAKRKRLITKRVYQEQKDFNAKVTQMLAGYNLPRTKMREIERKLADLTLIKIHDEFDRFEREHTSGNFLNKEKTPFLNEYGKRSTKEMITIIVREINEQYNFENTLDEKWLALQGKLFTYQAKNYQELTALEEIKETIRYEQTHQIPVLGEVEEFDQHEKTRLAHTLTQKIEAVASELQTEENEFMAMVETLKPDKDSDLALFTDECRSLTQTIEQKTNLYTEHGRSAIVQDYQQHKIRFKDLGYNNRASQDQSLTELYRQIQDKRNLTETMESAQSLRQNPTENLIREKNQHTREF